MAEINHSNSESTEPASVRRLRLLRGTVTETSSGVVDASNIDRPGGATRVEDALTAIQVLDRLHSFSRPPTDGGSNSATSADAQDDQMFGPMNMPPGSTSH